MTSHLGLDLGGTNIKWVVLDQDAQPVADGNLPTEPTYPTFADGHEELLLGEAIARSAREGRWIDIERNPR